MLVGIPKEIKNSETRVAITPAGVEELRHHGHNVIVEKGAGEKSFFADSEYLAAGAKMGSADSAWAAQLILKVKEPQPCEYGLIREQTIFTYLHLAAADRELAETLMKNNCCAIGYETIEKDGTLPLLAPMSAVAGRMAVQMGAHYLSSVAGGIGILIDGIPGVRAGKVVIIGAGEVGSNAARAAIGRGAKVTIVDVDYRKLVYLEDVLHGRLTTQVSTVSNIARAVAKADIVVGGVLIPGNSAPKLVTEDMVKSMRPGSVVVDVAIDQGGCVATSRPTTHENPVFVKHGVIHYCVTNMPAAYPRTSTKALTNATLPYAIQIANGNIFIDKGITRGINVFKGRITCRGVAEAHGLMDRYTEISELAR
ncbi:MAG: alanine dehydrogenase [archaeon]